jgi:hypothetical protein
VQDGSITKVDPISANRVIDDTVVISSEVVADVSVEKPLEDENTIIEDVGVDKSAQIENVVVVESDDVNPELAREASIIISPQSIFFYKS